MTLEVIVSRDDKPNGDGWYYRETDPGYLFEGHPEGPFETRQRAEEEAANEWADSHSWFDNSGEGCKETPSMGASVKEILQHTAECENATNVLGEPGFIIR